MLAEGGLTTTYMSRGLLLLSCVNKLNPSKPTSHHGVLYISIGTSLGIDFDTEPLSTHLGR